ncbi:unnamed protein product (macronuclear) [Paramecium tetraurelia]|uniref:Uncharacterized protein n=1 Tax=Paramecium tetraurelia TaxID=5888 RepID=A0CL11_PARTE|nr:uncharacterized protein GSPATT00008025001 [Paramecium tetraurelia]CAK71478.1 unnamed protein product [Paramecium tetraurelia]|eukprot:XP_001438875.1 hypothetical protein (macronuclear) [Paramecium tetraurelia strain d4-2]
MQLNDDQQIDKEDQFNNNQFISIRQVSLRLNVYKVHKLDFNYQKRTKVINQFINNEQNYQMTEQCNKYEQPQKNQYQNFTKDHKINTIMGYKQIEDDESFLGRIMQEILWLTKLANNESSKQEGQDKYQAATSWMNEMAQKSEEISDFCQQIQEVYKGINQILKNFSQKSDEDKAKENFQHVVLLNQNENKYCWRFLHVSSFVQNLLFQDYSQNKLKSLRSIYINFTGETYQKHIDFWSLSHHKNKKLSKFITLYPLNYNASDQQQENEFTNENQNKAQYNSFQTMINVKKNTNQQTIFPIFYKSILSQSQIQIIYSTLLLPIINSFQPQFIYLDLQISNKFQIQLEGVEYLLRQLQKKANLIVYPCYKVTINNKDVLDTELQNSYLNAVLSGISGFKMMKTKTLNDNTPQENFNWANLMYKSFYQSDAFMQKQTQFLKTQAILYDRFTQYYEVYQFPIRLENDLMSWIIPFDIYLSCKQFTNYYCFYHLNYVILFDQNTKSIFYQEISTIPKNIINGLIKQKFLHANVPKHLIEPSILIIGKYLIIVYGHEKSLHESKFFDGILIFDFEELEEFKEYQRVPDENTKDLLGCIRNRRCPQICQNNGFKIEEHQLSFFLIGGEFMKQIEQLIRSDNNKNYIEVVNVDLKTQKFKSYPIQFKLVHSQASLKPWPYQLVFEYSFQNVHLYLIQTGSYLLKRNKFQYPIDPIYHNYSQLLVQQDNQYSLYDIRVVKKKDKEYYLKIEQLYSPSRNWILEISQCSQSKIVWKAYLTRLVKLKNPSKWEILKTYKPLFLDINCNTYFQICIELTINLIIPNNHLDFKNYTVELDYEIMSLQKIND